MYRLQFIIVILLPNVKVIFRRQEKIFCIMREKENRDSTQKNGRAAVAVRQRMGGHRAWRAHIDSGEKRRDRRQSRPSERRSGKKVALAPRECRRLVQLGVCVALFLVVFVGKGVFPEQMLKAREKIVQVIQGDTDFRAAFASLGQSISAGEPVLDTLGELWVDVFGGAQIEMPDSGWEPLPLYTETMFKFQRGRDDPGSDGSETGYGAASSARRKFCGAARDQYADCGGDCSA